MHLAAIRSYIPANKEDFLADTKAQDAIFMRIQALGEEIAHLNKDFLASHPALELRKIIGLRNRIAHGYFEIDTGVIWDTLTDGSLDQVEEILKDI